jgi:hypothetical protein
MIFKIKTQFLYEIADCSISYLIFMQFMCKTASELTSVELVASGEFVPLETIEMLAFDPMVLVVVSVLEFDRIVLVIVVLVFDGT